MGDLKDPRLMWLKATLFLLIGVMAGAGVLVERFEWRTLLLLLLCVWAFCRAYYFAFYVVEHYIDSTYKFAGLLSILQYILQKRASGDESAEK